MDDVDVTMRNEEVAAQERWNLRKPVVRLEPTGYCHNKKCKAQLENEKQLFCHAKCAKQHG